MSSFSIVICTYNPDQIIFQRLLNAILQFNTASPLHEVILIDNNSSPSLSQQEYVQLFLTQKKNTKIIREETPGLTSARIAGIVQANYDWIVFLDDDNEPATDYLVEAVKVIEQYPQAGAWGPGIVEVELLKNPINKWYKDHLHLFQGKRIFNVQLENKNEWLDCYPNGTGLILKTEVAKEYVNQVEKGRYSLTDRIGKKLVSGGDTQMVLLAIKSGYFAGLGPAIRLTHIISETKISIGYILRQAYMTSSCYVRAFNEVNEGGGSIEIRLLSNKEIIHRIYSVFRIYFFKTPLKNFLLILYSRLGEINARYFATKGNPKPVVLLIFEKFINV